MGEVSPDTESVSESLSDQARPGFRKHDSYIEAIRSVKLADIQGVRKKIFLKNMCDISTLILSTFSDSEQNHASDKRQCHAGGR